MVLTLYKMDASPPVRAVFMTLEVLEIKDVKMVDVNLREMEQFKEDYIQMNPQHTVPTLKDDDFIVWDSHAIATYLVNKYAENHAIYPSEPKIRALIDQRLHFDCGVLFPALRDILALFFYHGEKTIRPENLAKITEAYEFTEKFLTKPWLVGDEMTLADICCVATISTIHVLLPINEDMYPQLAAWYKKMTSQEFFKKCNLPGLKMFKQILIKLEVKLIKNKL